MCFRKKLRSEANLDADEPVEDDSEDSEGDIQDISKINKKKPKITARSQNLGKPGRSALVNKFIAKHRKL